MNVSKSTTIEEIIQTLNLKEKEVFVNPLLGLDLEALNLPEFQAELEKILNGRTMGQLTFEEITKIFGDWNLPSIVEGMNHFVKTSENTRIFYDIQENSETALMAFPVPGKTPFAVICPGGGYCGVCSLAEGFPVAKKLNDLGISAFILHYRTSKYALCPNPMDDLACAVQYIVKHAEEFDICTENYSVIGFSAGGHLAASFGTETLGYKKYGLPKPGAVILGYPVITMGEKTHTGSRDTLLGDTGKTNLELKELYSIEKQINESYPPTYIWQCDEDITVPIENSQMMAEALGKYHIPYEYEVFHSKAHGWGLGTGTAAEGWLERAVRFWNSIRKS